MVLTNRQKKELYKELTKGENKFHRKAQKVAIKAYPKVKKFNKSVESVTKSIGKGFKGLAPKTYKSSKPNYKGFLNKLGGKR